MAAVPPVCDFGWKALDFSLRATDGKDYCLEDVRNDKGLVVAFICNHCPYVRSVAGRIAEEAKALAELGIGFAAICSNDAIAYPQDSFERMGEFAAAHGFSFPYLHDKTQEIAKGYGAVCTPDFFGFNADLELQYRGRLDASQTTRLEGVRRDLFEAMEEIARSGMGPKEQNASMGCSIKWKA
ncbi:MAG: thioredoxin family protein [Kiloniellales bacterium]|nr:thioredoxin family protein [Kiloniellales bacterium]